MPTFRPTCIATFLVMLASAVLANSNHLLAGEADGRLDIYWIDVEGGAATLLVTPTGETLLIDSGNPGRRDPDRIVKVITEVAKCKRIDHLVTTHYHGDHFGGAITLATLLPIGTLYDNGKFEGMPDNPGKAYFDLRAEKKEVLSPGSEIKLAQSKTVGTGEISVRCLGTRQQFVMADESQPANETVCAAAVEKNRDGSDNANSVVLLIQFGNWRMLDAGDLTWNQETKLVCPKNLIGKVDVYQTTHHGLDASNNPLVIQSIEPTVAIMNNGATKGGMPDVFESLRASKTLNSIYQLHKNLTDAGAKLNEPDEYIANLERECQGNYVHLSVAPDGKTYRVSIPANKHEREFTTRAVEGAK